MNEKLLRVGTSSWSQQDWRGTVYPAGSKPGEFLRHYAERYDTVEIDATWYRIPSETLVRKWERDTPAGFVFGAKVPGVITHEKMLVGCEAELAAFLRAMDGLGSKLGPLLLQFPHGFKPDQFETLATFLKGLPKGYKFAVEIRHKGWLDDRFHELLRAHGVAFALVDLAWMPKQDVLTAGWTYLRFVGDRKGIEAKTKTWDQVIVDRTKEMEAWVPKVRGFLDRQVPTYAYFNNHYAGHAPGSIELFKRMMAG
jgi:uncharacterized protein YecE (DUF72 family)